MTPESFLKAIQSAIIWKGLDKLVGLIKHIIIAAAIGLTTQLDIFYMTIALLGVLVFSWATLFDVVAVPNMVTAWQKGRYLEFRKIASGMFTLTVLFSLALSVLLFFGHNIVSHIALGFAKEEKKLLGEAILWMMPVVLLYIPFRLMGAILRALRQFSAFYQAEFIIAVVILISIILCRKNEYVLLWSFSAGIIIAFLFLFAKTWHYIFPLQYPFSPWVLKALHMTPGLLVLQGAQYVYVLTDRLFVSYLPQGAISALAYGTTLIAVLPTLIVFTGAFITVMAEQQSILKRAERLNDLLSMVIYIATAATVFMLIAGYPMIQLMLERGVFTASNTENVAITIKALAWIILPLFLIPALDQVFQVERKIGIIVRRTIFALLTNIVLSAWFLFGMKWGLYGVALATTISYWVMLLTSLFSLIQLGYPITTSRHLRWLCWNSVWLILAFILYHQFSPLLHSAIFSLAAAVILVGLAMLFAGLCYRGPERQLIYTTILRTIPNWMR